MKIRKLTSENYDRVSALLKLTFPGSNYEVKLVEKFHKNNIPVHEWVCIHTNRIIGYIAFSNGYKGSDICGFHLGPMAVKPEFQKQGIGSELLRFALRQPQIKEKAIFVSGNPNFFQKFGFELCSNPVSPLKRKKSKFMSLHNNNGDENFTIGYEPVF